MDTRNDDEELDDAAGTAGAVASGGVVGGAIGTAGMLGGVGAAIVGGMAARDLMDADEGSAERPTDADLADSPDSYAGGGATSSGQDFPDRDSGAER
jgi:hypothetical protein